MSKQTDVFCGNCGFKITWWLGKMWKHCKPPGTAKKKCKCARPETDAESKERIRKLALLGEHLKSIKQWSKENHL